MDTEATVLLVDDDENDVFCFKRALQKNNLTLNVQVASDGQQAIDYMSGKGDYADRKKFPFPKFVITDNRMPGVSGADFLRWLKQHSKFHVIPTVVFGGSSSPQEIVNAYENLGVNSYIIKPSQPDQLQEVVKRIFQYWAICAVPPPRINPDLKPHSIPH
jgi:CheY-like chemotaxis protein